VADQEQPTPNEARTAKRRSGEVVILVGHVLSRRILEIKPSSLLEHRGDAILGQRATWSSL